MGPDPSLAQDPHRDRQEIARIPGGRVHHERCRRRPDAARPARPDPTGARDRQRTADGAFDTRKCYDAIAAQGAAAIIPPRKNAKPWKPDTAGAVASNEILRTLKRVGRTIWRQWSGYHRRRRAETKKHYVKLLGQHLSAQDFDRQVAKFQVRVAVLNGFTLLGTPITGAKG